MQLNPLTRARWTLRLFGLFKVPLIWTIGPKIIVLNDNECTVRIPLRYRTKNHQNSLYIGALTVGADLACGLIGMYHIQASGRDVSLIFKDLKVNFLKRSDTHVDFICRDGNKIKQQVAEVIETGERRNLLVNITAYSRKNTVAEFVLSLSLKLKSSIK